MSVVRIEGYQRPAPDRKALQDRWNYVCPGVDTEIEALASRHPNAETFPFVRGVPAKHVIWKEGDFTHTLSLMADMTGSPNLYITGGLARLDYEAMERLSTSTPSLPLKAPFNMNEVRGAISTTERALYIARFVLLGQTNTFRVTREPIVITV
jgi:hypothetical protein